jgi:hypothetical protein
MEVDERASNAVYNAVSNGVSGTVVEEAVTGLEKAWNWLTGQTDSGSHNSAIWRQNPCHKMYYTCGRTDGVTDYSFENTLPPSSHMKTKDCDHVKRAIENEQKLFKPGQDFDDVIQSLAKLDVDVRNEEHMGYIDKMRLKHNDQERIKNVTFGLKNICSKPDPSVCDIGLDSKGQDPLVSWGWHKGWEDVVSNAGQLDQPIVRCSYNSDRVNTPSQIEAIKAKFDQTDTPHINASKKWQTARDFAARKLCSIVTTQNCKKNPLTGSQIPKCTVMMQDSEDGKWCQYLREKESGTLGTSICNKHPDLEECKCLLRFNDPDYVALAADRSLQDSMAHHNGSADSCWYGPCQWPLDGKLPAVYHVPFDLAEPSCPEMFCTQYNHYQNIRGIKVSGKEMKLTCNKRVTTDCDGSCSAELLDEEKIFKHQNRAQEVSLQKRSQELANKQIEKQTTAKKEKEQNDKISAYDQTMDALNTTEKQKADDWIKINIFFFAICVGTIIVVSFLAYAYRLANSLL